MVNVICMKWGTRYGAEYANRLRSMVERHLTLPHRFVCFTDDPHGLDPAVEHFPLPPMEKDPAARPGKGGGWKKLSTFAPRLYDLEGPALFLDLDLLVVDTLDPLFEIGGEFRIIHDWLRPHRITGNSSVYRFEVGQHADILDYFYAHTDEALDNHRNEQAYLSHMMAEKGILEYWPEEWCRSFKIHCAPKFPLNWFKAPALAPGARVVVFHGKPNPPEAIEGYRNGPFKVFRPAPWVEKHWR
jgi:hypothetical protein